MTNKSGERPALIYIDQALKNRLVSAAQKRGLKLAEYLSEISEQQMNVFKIPDALEQKYQGSGYALAASLNRQLIDIAYVRDHATGELAEKIEEGGAIGRICLREWMLSPEAGKIVRELQAKGLVHVGMCSNWEFVEL